MTPFSQLPKPTVLDVLRHPKHLLVGGDDVVDEFRHADEPRRHRPVDQRRVGAVAIGIAVHDVLAIVERAAVAQVADNVAVGVLDELAGEVAHVVGELPRHGDRANKGPDPRGPQYPVVVFAERRRLVNQPGAFVGGDVVVGDHDECAARALRREVVEQGSIAATHEFAALHPAIHRKGRMSRPVGVKARFGQVETPARVGVGDPDVVDIRANTHREVRRQRPRRRGPGREVGVLVLELEQHGNGRVLDVNVVLAGLEVGEHGLERRRHRHDLHALVDEPTVPQLLDDPPHGLHVPDVHGLVVVVEVDPAAEPRDGLAPLGDIALDDGAALGVVPRHTHLAHRLLGRLPKRLVDFLLDGKPVTVPSEAPQHVAPLHGPVARHNVFQDRADEVAVVGQTGGERRTVVEDVGLLLFGARQRLAEHVVILPVRQDVVLHRDEGERGASFLRVGHGGLGNRGCRARNLT